MAFKSKLDGKEFSMASRLRVHDSGLKAKKEMGLGKKLDVLKAPDENKLEEAEDGKEIAREHGGAHSLNIEHDHEAGVHRVHSEHPDGHETETEHASVDEAHNHARDLAGDGEEAEPQESDDEDGGHY